MNSKKLISLTESDLHRIVKESVNKVLNEVQFGGESLHGNNPEDWSALSDVRGALRRNSSIRDYDDNSFKGELDKNRKNRFRNDLNYIDTMKKERDKTGRNMTPDERNKFVRPYIDKGERKANNILKNINFKELPWYNI